MPDDPRTLVLVHFDETSTDVRAVEATGSLLPFHIQSNLFAPSVVVIDDAFSGNGREPWVTEAVGLETDDSASGDTLSTRDITVQWIASIKESYSTQARYLYQRGKGSAAGANQYTSIIVGIERTGTAGVYELWASWQDSSAGVHRQPGGMFVTPGEGVFALFTYTRRWETPTKVVSRYYVNDTLLAEHETVDGNIAGSTTGTTFVGCGHDPVSGSRWYTWPGVIDELKVTNYEMSHEEVIATFRRLTKYQPQGEMLAESMMPPGAGWTRDAGTRWGKLVTIAGQGLGYAISKVEEVRDTWLPHRASQLVIAQWENLYGAPRGQLDSLDLRRSRVVGLASRENGYSAPLVQEALEDALNVDSAAMTVIEFNNRLYWEFDTDADFDDEEWRVRPSSTGWTRSGNQLTVTAASTSDLRWDASNRNAKTGLVSLSNTDDPQRFHVEGHLSTATAASDVMIGICLLNFATDSLLVVGQWESGGEARFGYRFYNGVTGADSGFVELQTETGGYVQPEEGWWKVKHNVALDGETNLNQYILSWAAEADTGAFHDFTVSNLIANPQWVGFGVVGTDSSSAATVTLVLEDWTLFEPKGYRPLNWYIYVPPGNGENLDLANLIVQKVKPAHTHAAAITSMSLLCDDETRPGCDAGPMGGI